VYEQVVIRTPKQTPGKWSYRERGEIVITRAPGSGAPKAEEIEVPELEEEIEARLADLNNSGLEAYWLEDWEKATRAFQAIVSVRPDYPGAAERLRDSRRKGELAAMYEKAQTALKSEDWDCAVTSLEALVAQAPEYKDADAQLKAAKEQKRLTYLYAQAKQLYRAKKWHAAKKGTG
jgi:hypothetical protein